MSAGRLAASTRQHATMLMVSDMSDPHCDPGQDVDYRSEEALFKDIDQDDARRLRRVHGFEPNSDDEEDCEAYRREEEAQHRYPR